MTQFTSPILSFYAEPGPMTGIGPYADLLAGLPEDVPGLVAAVQGCLLHIFWADRYGLTLSDERRAEVQLRQVPRQLARLCELDPAPLAVARPLGRKLVGNCRDFSTLLVALLRHHGVPARARAGFGTYFLPGHYEDHWVGEYWNASEGRWMMVDAQLDELQVGALGIDFDPLDVPHDRFITGGHAWQMCRAGQTDPNDFGIFDMHGLGFVSGDLLRDFLALNKVEILPWDPWEYMLPWKGPATEAGLAELDALAALTLAGDAAFSQLRSRYKDDPRMRMPEGWPDI